MTAILIPYLIAITLLTLTPGLDTTLIIRTATLEGKSKAFQAALGVSIGCTDGIRLSIQYIEMDGRCLFSMAGFKYDFKTS